MLHPEGAITVASPIPIERMSLEEKLQAMESLWNDLCSRAGGPESPEWHGAELAERIAAAEKGGDQFEDWETAKRKIRNAVS
jgi:hypothetical protein